MPKIRPCLRLALVSLAALLLASSGVVHVSLAAQTNDDDEFVPVTDAMLEAPAAGDWLSWRRTTNGWGYSPLDQINRDNVDELRMVWTRALSAGSQTGTPLAYGGVLYMPNPNDVIQAIDAVTGDLIWEHRRENPEVYVGLWLSFPEQPKRRHPRPTSLSIRVSTTTSSPSTPSPVMSCGTPKCSITRLSQRCRGRGRSSPTAR